MEYHEPRGELDFTISEDKSVSEIRFLTFDMLVLTVIYMINVWMNDFEMP